MPGKNLYACTCTIFMRLVLSPAQKSHAICLKTTSKKANVSKSKICTNKENLTMEHSCLILLEHFVYTCNLFLLQHFVFACRFFVLEHGCCLLYVSMLKGTRCGVSLFLR